MRIIIQLFIWFLAYFVFGLIIIKYSFKYIKKLTLKTKTKLDDLFVDHNFKYFVFLIILISLHFTLVTHFSNISIVIKLIDTFIVFVFLITSIRFIDFLFLFWREYISNKITYVEKKAVEKAVFPLFNKFLNLTFLVVAIIISLKIWSIDVGPLIGGLGLAGLALSLAAKDTLENIFAGLFLIFDKSFKIDDIVELPELGISGVVHDIGLRSTRIKSWNNEIFIVPNSKISQNVIKNDMYPNLNVRIVIKFSVAYGSDIDKVKKLIKNAISSLPNVLEKPEVSIFLINMGDFSLDFEVRFWIKDVNERFMTKVKANELIYNTLTKNNIEIPYPTQNVYLKKE